MSYKTYMKKKTENKKTSSALKIAVALAFAFVLFLLSAFSVSALEYNSDFDGASKVFADALKAGQNEAEISEFNIPKEKISFLMNYSRSENTDVFWYPASIEYSFDKKSGLVSTISWENIFEDFSEIEEMRKDFHKYAEEAINVCFDRGMTDLEKIISAHDYLTEMCVYSIEDNYSHTAYSIFVRNEGVCQGYSYAFKYLMDAAGIECYIASSKQIDHAWNVVKLDGEFYNVDVTGDDGKVSYNNIEIKHGRSSHHKLLCSDSAFDCEATDIAICSLEEIPKCVSEKYDNAFFKNVRGSIEFIDGFWYYVEPSEYMNGSSKVLRTSADLSKTETFFQASNPVYAIAKHGKNIYCAVKDKVYVLGKNGKSEEVCSTVGEIFGLCVKENNLLYGVYRKKSYAICNKIIDKNLDCVEGINLDVSMDSIVLNVYFKNFIELSEGTVEYSFGLAESEKNTMKFKDIKNGVISIPVHFSRLEDDISVEVAADGKTKTFFMSLSDYFSSILEGDFDEKSKNLVKALLCYGGYSKDNETEIPPYTKTAVLDSSDEISYSGIELEVGKKVSVKVKFSVIGNAEFTVNGRYETKKNGLYYTVIIPDISFGNFEDEFIIRAKNISFSFSVFGLMDNCDEDTKEKITSVYAFGKALSSF